MKNAALTIHHPGRERKLISPVQRGIGLALIVVGLLVMLVGLFGYLAGDWQIAPLSWMTDQVFIARDHGRWYEQKGVWFMPTFHPSALLRDPAKKRDAWEDFQKIRDKLKELEDGEGE